MIPFLNSLAGPNSIYYVLLTFLLLPSLLPAQMGCTDSQAINFDAAATQNDGSCTYPVTNYAMTNIAILPASLNESSGLAMTTEGLWTHNDNGNADEIYLIDNTNGQILQTTLIANFENEDWEDLAQNEDYLYIGDFGNNNGNRMDLRILRIAKSDLGNLILSAELIEFSYSDQTDFSSQPNNNDYDCEAFFYHNDSLHLFSKNWVDNQTRHYTLPATPGTHVAQVHETFDVEGLVTGADISQDGVITLLGYTASGVNFMWLLFDYAEHQFFSGNKRKIGLGTGLTNSQTEGIVFDDQFTGYVSSESFNILPPRLLRFSIQEWVESTLANEDLREVENTAFRVFPNPVQRVLTIENLQGLRGDFQIALINQRGQIVGQQAWPLRGESQLELDLGIYNLPTGHYFLRIEDQHRKYFEQVVKIE